MNPRREAEIHEAGRIIRRTPSLIPRLQRRDHNYVHEMSPGIPTMDYFTLTRIVSYFKPTNDTLETIDNLVIAVEQAGRHKSIHPIQREVGQLAIEAMLIQRDVLAEVMNNPTRTYIDLGAK